MQIKKIEKLQAMCWIKEVLFHLRDDVLLDEHRVLSSEVRFPPETQ